MDAEPVAEERLPLKVVKGGEVSTQNDNENKSSIDPVILDSGVGFRSPEDVEAARQALIAFRTLLQELVSGVVERDPPKLTRNPLARIIHGGVGFWEVSGD